MSNTRTLFESKKFYTIKSALRQGVFPDDVKMEMVVVDPFTQSECFYKPVEILLTMNYRAADAKNYTAAKRLLAAGAELPTQLHILDAKSTVSEYQQYLIKNPRDLFIALHNDSRLINQQDENGQTLLHHAAKIGLIMRPERAALTLELLFSAPRADFTIRDTEGNTPLHEAALYCLNKVTRHHIFPWYVMVAHHRHFDFSALNDAGYAIIHILTHIASTANISEAVLESFLKSAPDADLNVLSESGTTAFHYASHLALDKVARTLLRWGADATCFSEPDRDPFLVFSKVPSEAEELIKKEESKLIIEPGNAAIRQEVGEKIAAIHYHTTIIQNLEKHAKTTVAVASALPFFKHRCKSEPFSIVGHIAELAEEPKAAQMKKM